MDVIAYFYKLFFSLFFFFFRIVCLLIGPGYFSVPERFDTIPSTVMLVFMFVGANIFFFSFGGFVPSLLIPFFFLFFFIVF